MIKANLLIDYGATCEIFSTGKVTFYQSNKAACYYQIVTGCFKLINVNDEGTAFIQETVADGECFGDMSLFNDEPFSEYAIAEKESTVFKLNVTSFHRLLNDNREILMAFTRLMSQRLRNKFLIVKRAIIYDPEHIIIALLNYYRNEGLHFYENCNQLILTKQQLAGLIGMRVETVIRSLRSLEKKGKLILRNGEIFL